MGLTSVGTKVNVLDATTILTFGAQKPPVPFFVPLDTSSPGKSAGTSADEALPPAFKADEAELVAAGLRCHTALLRAHQEVLRGPAPISLGRERAHRFLLEQVEVRGAWALKWGRILLELGNCAEAISALTPAITSSSSR